MIEKIVKRDGSLVNFNKDKITTAIKYLFFIACLTLETVSINLYPF